MPNVSVASKERSKRQTLTKYWERTYGVHIHPDDIELYNYFKNNRKLIISSIPHFEMLQKIMTLYIEPTEILE